LFSQVNIVQIKKSSCRICINCGFDFQVENNKIVSFEPDFDHPHTKGYCCPKGIAGIEFQQGAGGKRIIDSLEKSDDGRFTKVNTLQTADKIGRELKAIVDKYGPRSVALYFGTGGYANTLGNAFSKAWLDAIGSPNFFSTFTIDGSSHLVTAGRMGVFLGGSPHLDDIDVGLVSGANPIVAHSGWPHLPIAALNPGENFAKARKRGMKLIVVDPRKTELAQRADIHLQLIPGEDATLYAGIIRIMLENKWVEQEFCRRFVTNVDRLQKMVAPYKDDYVAKRTGVPAEKLHEAARMFGTAARPWAGNSTGTSMTRDSNLADFLVKCLNALQGSYARAGEKVKNPCYLSSMAPPMETVLPPTRSWENEPKCRTQDIGKIGGEFPSALFPDEILVPGKDKIRAVVVFGANPVMCMPETDKTIAALKDLDLLVTLDNTMSETAVMSDYVLATSPQYERHDLNGMTEALYPESYVQYFKPLVEKPENVAHDWQVFWIFARAMNVELELKHMTLMSPFEVVPSAGRVDMKSMPKSEDLIRRICESKGLDFEALKEAPEGISPDIPDVHVIAPPEDSGARMDLCPDDIARDLTQLHGRPVVHSRYRLAVRRIASVMNSQYRDSNLSRAKFPEAFAYMNPNDMLEEGVMDGMQVDICTASGQIVGTVKGDETVREGVISMPHCYGNPFSENNTAIENGSHTSRLIPMDPNDSEPINFMPRMTGFPVDLKKRL